MSHPAFPGQLGFRVLGFFRADGCLVGDGAAVDETGWLLRINITSDRMLLGASRAGPGHAWREAVKVHVGNITPKDTGPPKPGQPGWPAGTGGPGEWTAEVKWLEGDLWKGRLRGLRPVVEGSGSAERLLTDMPSAFHGGGVSVRNSQMQRRGD